MAYVECVTVGANFFQWLYTHFILQREEDEHKAEHYHHNAGKFVRFEAHEVSFGYHNSFEQYQQHNYTHGFTELITLEYLITILIEQDAYEEEEVENNQVVEEYA